MSDVVAERRCDAPARPHLRWWRELLYVAAFYSVYTLIRNHGVVADAQAEAFRHAKQVIAAQRLLGIYHEETIQDLFLPWRWFISFWDVYYGTAHFVVTAAALVYLFRHRPDRYPLWRNTLACTTGLALVGFALYPLMPPRLLPPEYGFVDTLRVVGGLWSFESAPMEKVSNQYAAMPSLHFAWSLWCVFVLSPALRRRWARMLLIAYPGLTLFAVVVTANHYFLDALGGVAVLALGYWLARALTGWLQARRDESPATTHATHPA